MYCAYLCTVRHVATTTTCAFMAIKESAMILFLLATFQRKTQALRYPVLDFQLT